MKKKLLAVLICTTTIISTIFTGCGNTTEKAVTPDAVESTYYTSEEELPSDAYYIVHKTKDGKVYYPLYDAQHTYEDIREAAAGDDPTRVTWVNYNQDEGLIPTFYKGDSMIYKSSTVIPTKYALEKFYDEGYSFGVMGLQQDLSKNYQYNPEKGGYTMSTSDAIGFDSLQADSIYFVSCKDVKAKKKDPEIRINETNVSPSGTVMGLTPFAQYNCDIRTGTEKIAAVLTANIHVFSSAETYIFGSFDFITEHIAKINLPDYATTGYYNINGGGFFRYVPAGKTCDKLTADDYNETIYTYTKDGGLDGTTIGLTFDENWFLVEPTVSDEDGDPLDEDAITTEDATIFSKDIQIQTVSDAMSYATETTDGMYFEIVANVVDTTKILNLRYYIPNNSAKDIVPVKDGIYSVIYTKDDGSYFEPSTQYTWMITEMKEVSVPETAETDTDTEAVTGTEETETETGTEAGTETETESTEDTETEE